METKISVVTATLNRVALLERCLNSVRDQNYCNYEHIVIDGGSKDGTKEFLQNRAATDPNLKWISEPDDGISDAFNKGLAMMTGDCVAVLGDDDVYLPNAFTTINKAVKESPQAGLWSGGGQFVNSKNEPLATMQARYSGRRELIQSWRNWNEVVLLAPSTFISQAAIEKAGNFRVSDRYSMDYRHWIEITRHFDVIILTDVLARIRLDVEINSYNDYRSQSFFILPKPLAETMKISREYWMDYGVAWWLFNFLSYSLWRVVRSKDVILDGIFWWGVRHSPEWIKKIRRRLFHLPSPGE